MLLKPSTTIDGNDFSKFQRQASKYGSKAAGLMLLPKSWCPEFVAVSANLHRHWIETGTMPRGKLGELQKCIDALNSESVIVRSSGIHERIGDRGKFKSIRIRKPHQIDSLAKVIIEIFEGAARVDSGEQMGLVVQEYLLPTVSGHLSNEVRVSPTRNQWKYEIERPSWVSTKGLNSKFAPFPESNNPISCGNGVPHQSLRSVGKWMTEKIAPRCHIEWLSTDETLWLVQLDLEWQELDEGCDPTNTVNLHDYSSPRPDKASRLRRYKIGEDTEWKKLKNLSEFDFDDEKPGPNIFLLPATEIQESAEDTNAARVL